MSALTEDVEKRLQDLSKSTGRVDPEDILEVVQSVMASIEGDHTSLSQRLHDDIEALAEYISSAKTEITEIRVDEINTHYLPEASNQLSAIVGATEKATNEIFDAVEKIEELAATLPPKKAEGLSEAVTQIYEACSFQDITGQRISKVVTVLQNVETRVDALLGAFGTDGGTAASENRAPAEEPATTESGAKSEKDLLSGPQLPGTGNSQEDIDALLASFD
jgi:chemotaxis protein CheZ